MNARVYNPFCSVPGMGLWKSRRLIRIIAFYTCFLLQPNLSQAAEVPISELSASSVANYTSSLRYQNYQTYNPAQLLLLNRELVKRDRIPQARTVLRKLSQSADWSVKPIVAVEQIKVYLKTQDRRGLLNFLAQLAKGPDGVLYENSIFSVLAEHYSDYTDRRSMQTTLRQLLPATHKWREDSELIGWMLGYFAPGDDLYGFLVEALWAAIDIHDFPAAYRPEIARIKMNPDIYQKTIVTHIRTQYRLKNWSYIIAEVPGILVKMNPGSAEYKRVRDTWFKTYFRKRQYQELITLLNKPNQAHPVLTADEKSVQLFRLWLKKGYLQKAKSSLAQLVKRGRYQKPGTAYFELAEFYFNRNRFTESLPYYLKITPENAPAALIPLVQWRKLWAYYRLNQPAHMRKIAVWANNYPFESKEVAAKFCYWNAKLKISKERRVLSCFQEYPLTYYGFRALQMGGSYAGIEKTMISRRRQISIRPLSTSEQGFLDLVNVVYLNGDTEFGDTLVMRYMQKHADLDFFRKLAGVLYRAERYYTQQLLVELFFKETLKKRKTTSHPLLPVYYPVAFSEEVNRHNGRSPMPEMLAYAVIREESNFRPEVTSPAGAVGLMQLMPSTAAYVAKLLRTTYHPDRLNHPDFNVRLGVTYLKRLLRRYKGNLFYTLAAYNGGATNVKRWRKKAHSADYDVFVETITYIETQDYVKRVIRSFYIYQLLYGEKAPVGSPDRLSSIADRLSDPAS